MYAQIRFLLVQSPLQACTDFYHFIQCPPVIGRPHIPTLNRCKKLQKYSVEL